MSAGDDANLVASRGTAYRRGRAGDRRTELVTVAAELFGRSGYHGVGVTDIASAAGITGPALYRHFASKEELLSEVLLSALDTLNALAREHLEGGTGDPGRRLRGMLRGVAELSVQRRDITALWRWQGAHLSPEGRRAVLHRGARLLDCFAHHLRACRPDLPAADAELLCWAALSVFGSAAVHRTRIAKRRHVDLLLAQALAVVYADLSPVATPSGRATPSWAREAATRPTRRETLLAEATGLFRRRGFHAVSIEEIGQAAGLAPASVYRHFSGKTDLLLTACRRMADRLAADAERVVAGADGPWEALTALLASYAGTFLRNVDLVAVYLTELPNLPGPERTELERLQRAYVSRWVALLRAARPELDESAARVTVHVALTVVNDLARTRQVASRPALSGELELLGTLCLSAPDRTEYLAE